MGVDKAQVTAGKTARGNEMATKVIEGTGSKQIANINNGKLFEGTSSSRQIAKVDTSGKIFQGTSSTAILNIKSGKIYEGTSSRQVAKFEGGTLYRGTSFTKIAHMDGEKICEGSGYKVIGKIDGPATAEEKIAVFKLVFGLF